MPSFSFTSLARSTSNFASCSFVELISCSMTSRFLYTSWAFARFRRSESSRYFKAPSRSADSWWSCFLISSRMIWIRPRFSSVCFRFESACPMSSSNFVIPAMLSRTFRRSTSDIDTIRWMSPC